jgi:di/tricarboxylate transporter
VCFIRFRVTGLDTPQIVFFAILAVAFVLLLTERIRNDVVALLIVLALAVTGLLPPKEALAGFGSEPAIVVAAIFVLSEALHRTGVSDTLGRWIGRLAGATWSRAIAVMMPSVAMLSAFTHHVTTTAVMLPVALQLSRERKIAASKLLMPLSFAASLGTTITIIGAPAFLVAGAALQQAGRPGLGIFSIAPIGLALSAAGTAFVLLMGHWLLPERKGVEGGGKRFRLDDYFTEITVLEGSPFLGKTVEDVEGSDAYKVSVVGLVRDGHRRRRPFGPQRLEPGDVLLVRTSPEDIVAIRSEAGFELHPVAQYQPRQTTTATEDDPERRLVQAVVAPRSEFVGRTISALDFRRRFDALVLGLWRQQAWLDDELAQTPLRAGDVLVLQGDDDDLNRVARDPGFLMMMPFRGEPRLRRKAPLGAAIMLATVVAASLNVPLEIATLGGAVVMVLVRCLTVGQAYRAIDAKVYVFIAGAIPLGIAMEKTGTSKLLAGWLKTVLAGWHELLVLGAVFAIVAVLTQFMSDAATTALFAPVAAALAQGLGRPLEPYVVTVAMASVASFLTPIGHHGNLLIYAPGRYRFADFVRVGMPLTIVVGVVVVLMASLLWGG